jgi:protein gp37
MSDKSKIEWTDASWPVVTGCTHVSPGCDNCYAARLTSGRLKHLPAYAGLAVNGRFTGEARCHPDRLDWPLKWRKPRRIFVADMGDLFHDGVPEEFIAAVFGVMARSPQHTFQVLTKRHGRMRSLLNNPDWAWSTQVDGVRHGFNPDGVELNPQDIPWPLPNVHLGVSAEDPKWAGIRVPALLATPAAVRFVSAEPLLGPVDLTWCHGVNALWPDWAGGPGGGTGARHPLLDWVIAGGESGPGARPMDLAWARSVVAQCQEAEVPVFVKQLGSVLGKELAAGPKGGDWSAWPEDLRVREFPAAPAAVAT